MSVWSGMVAGQLEDWNASYRPRNGTHQSQSAHNDSTLGGWFIELATFVTLWIANKHVLLIVRS